MSSQNLKEFSVEWALIGLLFFSLIAFASTYVYNNSPGALGYAGDKLVGYGNGINSSLMSLEHESNVLLNISSQSDPEVSDWGSKDSVATSYGLMGTAKDQSQNILPFVKWILSPNSDSEGGATLVSVMLISVLAGLLGITALYYITKWIRNGI